MDSMLSITKDMPYYRQEGVDGNAQGSIFYFEVAVAFGLLMFCLEYYLDLRQHYNYATIKEIPALLVGKVPAVEFNKSQAYNLDKSTFSLLEKLVMEFHGVFLLCLGQPRPHLHPNPYPYPNLP